MIYESLCLYRQPEFESWRYDKAVIISGDGDFHCLIEYLLGKEKLLKIIVPNRKYSSLLRKFSGFMVNIQNFKQKLLGK